MIEHESPGELRRSGPFPQGSFLVQAKDQSGNGSAGHASSKPRFISIEHRCGTAAGVAADARVAAGALILAAARPLLPESRAELRNRRFDVAGAVTVTGGLTLLVYAVVTASSHGWASATTIGLLTAAAALIAAFVIIETRSAAPLLPLSFVRNRTVTGANLAGLLIGALMFPMFFFLSLYMQQVLGYSAIKTGLAFLVIAAGTIVSSGAAPGLETKTGPRAVIVAGLVLLAAAQVLFLRVPVIGGYATDLLPGFIIVALGLGLAFVGDVIASATGVGPADASLASGLINTSQQIGGDVRSGRPRA
jgi:Major Facilitator Superfamily